MNVWDIALLAGLAAVVLLAGRKILRDRKQGKCACGGDCGHCMQGCADRKKGS